jgi:hypothetical protein
MSCCGGKREELSREWRVQTPAVEVEATPEPAAHAREARTFESIAIGSVAVRGAVTGTVYRFTHRGDQVDIAADDIFGMMAEPDIRPAFSAPSSDRQRRAASSGRTRGTTKGTRTSPADSTARRSR